MKILSCKKKNTGNKSCCQFQLKFNLYSTIYVQIGKSNKKQTVWKVGCITCTHYTSNQMKIF